VNLTTYVLGSGGKPHCVVVVNKDGAQAAQLSIEELRMGDVYVVRLVGASPDSGNGITLGGSSVDADGQWKAESKERIRDGAVSVPRMSAVVLCAG
jgi:hypothetical protein